MQSIFPSIEIDLPADWCLSAEKGKLLCHFPQLWIQTKESFLPEKSQKVKSSLPQLVGILLRFQGDCSIWSTIQEQLLLGYTQQKAGAVFGGSFDKERLFCFEAALCSSQLTLLSLMNFTPAQLQEQFVSGQLSPELQCAQNYRLLSVTQAMPNVPHVQIGLTMDWSS